VLLRVTAVYERGMGTRGSVVVGGVVWTFPPGGEPAYERGIAFKWSLSEQLKYLNTIS